MSKMTSRTTHAYSRRIEQAHRDMMFILLSSRHYLGLEHHKRSQRSTTRRMVNRIDLGQVAGLGRRGAPGCPSTKQRHQSGNVEYEKEKEEELKINQNRPQIKTGGRVIGIGRGLSSDNCARSKRWWSRPYGRC